MRLRAILIDPAKQTISQIQISKASNNLVIKSLLELIGRMSLRAEDTLTNGTVRRQRFCVLAELLQPFV